MVKIIGESIGRKLIVVDGENCYGAKLHNKLSKLADVEVVVIVGKGQNVKDYNEVEVKLVEAKSGEKNALDFVVVSVAVDALTRRNYSQAVIVSDDKGYDAAIDYLREQGHNIQRQKSNLTNCKVYMEENQELALRSLINVL